MLKGYWSKQDSKYYSYGNGEKKCKALGAGWIMPDIYQLNSLFSQKNHPTEGFINPIFSDTDQFSFWSSTQVSSLIAWRAYYKKADLRDSYMFNNIYVRCFRLAP